MIAEVVVDISNDSVDRVYDYLALDNTREGMRVKVPFAGRTVLGYVFRLKKEFWIFRLESWGQIKNSARIIVIILFE